jgi:hypothetical protein
MIPVPSWAAFADKGGAGQIQYLPVKDVAFIIESCVQLRKQLLDDIYQITGLSDIMRGESQASETATAQNLKAQYGSVRLRDTKDDFVRFAKEACEITAEIVSELYTSERLAEMAALPVMQMDPQTQQPAVDPQTGQPAQAEWLGLLRNQVARDVLIDVETDSTVQGDEDAEKQRRMELLSALTESMQPLLALNQLDPAVAAAVTPLWGDTVSFVLRGFRAGRELEETVEQTMQQLVQLTQGKAQAAQQAQQAGPPPDPALEAEKAKTQERIKQTQIDSQAHQEKVGREDQLDAKKAQRADELAQRQHQRDLEKLAAETQHTIARKKVDIEHAQRSKAMELDHAGKQKEMDFGFKQRDAEHQTQTAAAKAAEGAGKKDEGTVLTAVAKGLEAVGKGQEALAAALTKPKTVIRGPDGKAQGIQ